MIDLALFRRPAFVGAQTTAFAISSSMFAMFLYLTLYLQNILGLSPLETGVRFLPLSRRLVLRGAARRPAVDARADPRAARIRARAERARDVVDEPRDGIGSHWTVLLPGFLLAGVGIGFVNAPLATTAVSTVRRGARRDGVGDQQHLPPGRHRHRHRGARRDLRRARSTRALRRTRRVARVSCDGLHDILLVGAVRRRVGAVLAAAARPAAGLRRLRPGRRSRYARRASRARAG